VTGGSAGLGLALAILLTKRGADVSIVARNEERLQKALDEMEVRVHFLSLLWVMIYIYIYDSHH
jgi:short-subunit dehydrogenase